MKHYIAGAIVAALVTLTIIFMVGYGLAYFFMSVAPQENTRRVLDTVQAVCDYSRGIDSGEAEEACGIALDTSNTDYRCPSYDAPTQQCVVVDIR